MEVGRFYWLDNLSHKMLPVGMQQKQNTVVRLGTRSHVSRKWVLKAWEAELAVSLSMLRYLADNWKGENHGGNNNDDDCG